MVDWQSDVAPSTPIRIESVDWFSARGMRRVYGRGDIFPSKCSFNMEIWRDRTGRLLARFWSRSREVDDRSLEVIGIPPDAIPDRKPDEVFQDSWIPQGLRTEYEDWICE
jgi:hypothetical protein